MTDKDTVEIQDLNHFVTALVSWHEKKVKVLEHMLNVPEGVETEMSGQAPIKLIGDALIGFRTGISLALMELGTLPFVTVYEEPNEQSPPT